MSSATLIFLPNSSCFRIFQDRGIVVPRLSFLDLSFNGLTEVPELMENIPDLRNLKISHNRVSRITGDELGNINNLNLLSLFNNILLKTMRIIGCAQGIFSDEDK